MRRNQLKQTVGDPTVYLFEGTAAKKPKAASTTAVSTPKAASTTAEKTRKPVFQEPPQAVDLAAEQPVQATQPKVSTGNAVAQPAVLSPERTWKPQIDIPLSQRSSMWEKTTTKKPERDGETPSLSNDSPAPFLNKPVMTQENAEQNLTNWVNTWLTSSNSYFDGYNARFGNRKGDFSDAYVGDSQEYLDATNRRARELAAGADSIRRSLEQYGSNLNPEWVLAVNQLLDERLAKHEQVKQTAARDAQYWAQFQDEDVYKSAQQYQKMLDTNLKVLSVELQQLERKLEEAQQVQSWIDNLNKDIYANKPGVEEKRKKYEQQLAELTKEWGDYEGLKAACSEKEQYYNTAKRYQEWAALANVVNNADFKANSHRPVTDDPWFDTGNDVYKRFVNMEEEEKAIYNYHFNTGGEDAAEAYYDSIVENLNYRQAEIDYQQIEGKTFLEIEQGIRTGFDQFGNGLKGLWNTVTGNENYVPTSKTQYLGAMAREGLADNGFKVFGNSLGQLAYDVLNTTANMAPSMFVGTVNPALGATLMGASAAGNAYEEMINAGYSKGQARTYAALVGGSEAGLSYLLGGIGSLGGTLTNGLVDTLASKVSNIFAKAAIQLGGKVVSEAVEEGLQEILTPWFMQTATNIQQEKADWEAVAYAGLLGGITALISDGKSTVNKAKIDAAITKMEKAMKQDSAKLAEKAERIQPAEKTTDMPEVKFTDTEIQSIQSIGRKSVNSFTEQDAAATEKLAQRYWEELGEKSPFYRAKNGDWRETEQTAVQIATKPDATRGVQKNADTGWDIQVSGQVFNETKTHNSKANREARAYLPYINDIVKNAVLLDSYAIDSGKTKSQNSLMMHSMYAVADMGKGPEVLKLYVEEMNDPNKKTTVKRAYQIQNIEKAFDASVRVQGNTSSSITNATNAIHTVADLFAAVKAKDAAFQPKTAQKTANGKVGWDGRVAVTEAKGPNITVDGVTYKLLGLDKNGSKVYQDAEVLKQQAAKEKTAENQDKATQTENGQEAVENSEDRDILTLSTRYLNKNDSLYEYSGKITPLEGFEDVVTHGDPISLVFKDADGKESNVSAEEFVQILKDDPNYKGGNIRLVACQVAANGGAIPKYIAKELGVTVIAPTEAVNVDWDGNMLLADDEANERRGIETGEWLVFEPGKEGVSYDLYWRIRGIVTG